MFHKAGKIMAERYDTSINFRREELRGLFALGLLAIVATIRIQNPQIIWTIDGTAHNVTGFFSFNMPELGKAGFHSALKA